MNTSVNEAVLLTLIMAAVIFFCRVCAFLFFHEQKLTNKRTIALLGFVEKFVPPIAMTVLAFNALTAPINQNIRQGIPVLIAAIFTVIVHLWRRNPLLSIFGGTAVFMVIERLLDHYV